MSPQTSSLTSQSSPILTNQGSAFWTNQTVKILSPHLHMSGPIQDQRRDFSLHKSAPNWLKVCTFLCTEDCFPDWTWKTEDISLVWTGVEQSCLAGDGLHSRATLPEGPHAVPQPCCIILSCDTIELSHNCAILQDCCITIELFALNTFSFFTGP